MLLARRLDETMWTLRRQGKGHFAVPAQGHEAIGAAAGLAVDLHSDVLVPHYRDISAVLAWGLSARNVMAHYFGRAVDPCSGGRQPYAHWGSRERRIVSMQGPQPNQVTHGVGMAYAARLLGERSVVWIGFGDGGAQKGEVHEGMNFAAIHRLPVVFCVENNCYTQSVPLSKESSVADLSVRAQGYGIPGVTVDGMDLEAVYAAAKPAVDRARAGGGPTLIEAKTYRYLPNTSNDDDSRYRGREEVARWRERDPLQILRSRLVERGSVSEAEADAIAAEVAEEVAEAAAWAEGMPEAEPEAALLHTWGDEPVRGWTPLTGAGEGGSRRGERGNGM
jgi:2-oxoisovalerate dehydrogenase E1 component alpha subunit